MTMPGTNFAVPRDPGGLAFVAPDHDCALCPRLRDFRRANRRALPEYHNAPVPSFGETDARLLVVGLAPGLKGANRTGRPFTGDFAGDLLYGTLLKFGLALGAYAAKVDDGLILKDCRITNAVRCVPPENKPTPDEMKTCNAFLRAEIAAMPRLAAVVALGAIAHDAVLVAFGARRASARFAHGARHSVARGITLFDSYHCSRYNTNTGKLTEAMFHAVFAEVRQALAVQP
ncbi:MAG TPA: uracil-DNA glycosylase [Candidatus Cybelea sp.]|nr:uracil-DNA glycosylase [Candidatus Cybelea sp.]